MTVMGDTLAPIPTLAYINPVTVKGNSSKIHGTVMKAQLELLLALLLCVLVSLQSSDTLSGDTLSILKLLKLLLIFCPAASIGESYRNEGKSQTEMPKVTKRIFERASGTACLDKITVQRGLKALELLALSHPALKEVRSRLISVILQPQNMITLLSKDDQLLSQIITVILNTENLQLQQMIGDNRGPLLTVLMHIALGHYQELISFLPPPTAFSSASSSHTPSSTFPGTDMSLSPPPPLPTCTPCALPNTNEEQDDSGTNAAFIFQTLAHPHFGAVREKLLVAIDKNPDLISVLSKDPPLLFLLLSQPDLLQFVLSDEHFIREISESDQHSLVYLLYGIFGTTPQPVPPILGNEEMPVDCAETDSLFSQIDYERLAREVVKVIVEEVRVFVVHLVRELLS